MDAIIVGRGADYVLKDNPNLIRIFLYVPLQYRIENVKKMYSDNEIDAKNNILKIR